MATSQDKKFDIVIMKLDKSRLIGINNYLVHGSFPNEATVEYECKVPLKNMAMAFSVDELEEMLAYRKALLASIMGNN